MFCPECGKSNPEGLQNCQYCNAELIDNLQPKTPEFDVKKVVSKVKSADYKTFIQSMKAKKKIIIPVAAVIILLLGFIVIGGIASSPDRLVKSYIESYITADYQKMYSYLAITEDDFINKESFEKYMLGSSKSDISQITNYTISPLESINGEYEDEEETDKLLKTYEITYITDGEGYEHTLTIDLVKQSGRSWLFFNKYKVALNNAVHKNYVIYAPSSVTVEVDGTAIAGEPLEDKPNSSYYTIKAIFSGTHDVKITGSIINDYTDSLYIEASGSASTGWYDNDYDKSYFEFEFKDSEITAIKESASDFVTNLYKNALAGKGADSLTEQISSTYDDFSNDYENIRKETQNISSLQFYDFSMVNGGEHCVDGVFKYSFRLNFKNNYLKNVDGASKPQAKTKDLCSAFMSCCYEDGKWKVNDISTDYVF